MDTDGAKRRVFVNCTVTDNSKRIEEEAMFITGCKKRAEIKQQTQVHSRMGNLLVLAQSTCDQIQTSNPLIDHSCKNYTAPKRKYHLKWCTVMNTSMGTRSNTSFRYLIVLKNINKKKTFQFSDPIHYSPALTASQVVTFWTEIPFCEWEENKTVCLQHFIFSWLGSPYLISAGPRITTSNFSKLTSTSSTSSTTSE